MTNSNPALPSSIGLPLRPTWLHELRELVATNIHLLTTLDAYEWDVLTRLPNSQYWRQELNDTARNVLFDEYEVVYLDDLYEGVCSQDLPEWFMVMRACGEVICHTPAMNSFIEELLEKLDGLSPEDNHALTRIVELTYTCRLVHQLLYTNQDELLMTVKGLKELPLWAGSNMVVH